MDASVRAKPNLVTDTRAFFTANDDRINNALQQMKTQDSRLIEFHSAITTLKHKLFEADPQETEYPQNNPQKENQLFASVLRAIAKLIDKSSNLTDVITNKIYQATQDFINNPNEYTPFLRLLEAYLSPVSEDFTKQGLPHDWIPQAEA
ncbi:MAG: hypothetical protein O3C63_06145 [Cyanobacteria bacterium]|nr:hypothetical protein [Cyanobacteriota bacterium]MDA1020928.1 hypothetical protein [Cyanobacteriota bacterium]